MSALLLRVLIIGLTALYLVTSHEHNASSLVDVSPTVTSLEFEVELIEPSSRKVGPTNITSSRDLEFPRVTSANCPDECQCSEIEDLVQFDCSKFFARLQIGEILGVECKEMAETLPTFLNISEDSIPYIRLINCPLPINESFSNIILPTTNLTLSLRGSRGKLQRSHFTNMENITRLDLAFNHLKLLPEDLFADLESLEWLDLNDNDLTELHPNIFQPTPKLSQLHLDNNQLSEIPEKIFANLSSLWFLSLWRNELTNINGSTFSGLINLQHLDLSYNMLTFLRYDTFSDLKSLKTIDISYNSFQTLPVLLFYGLKNLNRIKINGNSKSVDSSQEVEWIKGNNKELELTNYIFSDLPQLQKISIFQSGLLQIPRFSIRASRNLVELDLHGNSLKTLPRFMLQDAKLLMTLDISDNEIEQLPHDLFSELTQLRELRLGGNKLSFLPRSYTLYASLEVFQVHDNALRALPRTLVRQLHEGGRLRQVSLAGNPWQCDCEAAELISFVSNHAPLVTDLNSVTCEDGRKLAQLVYLDVCN